MPATARPTHTHSHAGGPAGTKPKRYNPRHPERTLLHQTIAEHFETWHALASAGQFDGQATPPRLRTRLLRGLFLQRPVRLPLVQHLSAAATAAQLTDHVFPKPTR